MGLMLAVSIVRAPVNAQISEPRLEAVEAVRFSIRRAANDGSGEIGDLAVDDRRRMYLLDRDGTSIVVTDSNGVRLSEIHIADSATSQSSSGSRIGIQGDSLWVLDPVANRVTWVTKDGVLLRSTTVRIEWQDSVGTRNRLAGVLADGSYYGAPFLLSSVAARGLVELAPFLRMDELGTVFDTLLWLNVPLYQTVAIELGPGRASGYTAQLISDMTLFQISPAGDHVVIADRQAPSTGDVHRFAVRRIGITGDTLASVRVPYVPIRLTEAILDTLIRRRFQKAAPFGGRVDIETYRAALWKPRYLPPLEDLRVGIDRSIWLDELTIEHAHDRGREWLVVTPALDGRFRVTLPDDFVVMEASLHDVWGVWMDRTGAHTIGRYRLFRSPRRDV